LLQRPVCSGQFACGLPVYLAHALRRVAAAWRRRCCCCCCRLSARRCHIGPGVPRHPTGLGDMPSCTSLPNNPTTSFSSAAPRAQSRSASLTASTAAKTGSVNLSHVACVPDASWGKIASLTRQLSLQSSASWPATCFPITPPLVRMLLSHPLSLLCCSCPGGPGGRVRGPARPQGPHRREPGATCAQRTVRFCCARCAVLCCEAVHDAGACPPACPPAYMQV
jgi:hypothetical protein